MTSLKGDPAHTANASKDIAAQLGDSIKRIDGSDPVPTWRPVKSVANKASSPKQELESAETNAQTSADVHADAGPKPSVAETNDDAPGDEDKPELLTEARDGTPDDLKKIKGVGSKLEKLCNALGVWHFDQIASWTDSEVAWVDFNLEGFKGRIVRDDWVAQAKILAAGGETEFSSRN